MEKIFVQIASYRDPECQWTVKDLFEKAAHPGRVFVGISWYCDKEEDKDCFAQPYPHPGQVRTHSFPPQENKGKGFARMLAQSLWRGEDYVLQIAAHTRFEKGWDEALINTLARCPSDKAVLSACLPGYTPPDTILYRDEARTGIMIVQGIAPEGDPQILHLRGGLLSKNVSIEAPIRTPFWVGSFLFARNELLIHVPPDPHIFFHGEEIAYSARLWTHGWDIFQPDSLILYHWWGYGSDNPRAFPFNEQRQKQSLLRVKHLLRLQAAAASEAIAELEHYGLGNARTLADFWRFVGVNLHTGEIADYALRGKWEEAFAGVMQQAKQADAPQKPRIFVQIASYRDPECQWTVKDLFEKAKYPDRVTVGVCWQYDPEEDKDYFRVSTRPEQVRVVHFHWKESQGICWARNQTQLLWQGEEYTLIIDSHMRFVFDWDEHMINELAECPSSKPVLTSYPAAYTPPHDLQEHSTPVIQLAQYIHPGEDVRFSGPNLDRAPEKPLRGAFIAGGLIFAKSDIIREVPYDPYLYFHHDELSLAVRFFTHGWDVFSLKDVLVYHFYNTSPDRKKRPLHWDDHRNWEGMRERARKRLDHLLGRTISGDPDVTRDIMKYGLGDARTLQEYETFCGIDFKRGIVSERAMRGGFIEGLSKYLDNPIYVPELDGPRPL